MARGHLIFDMRHLTRLLGSAVSVVSSQTLNVRRLVIITKRLLAKFQTTEYNGDKPKWRLPVRRDTLKTFGAILLILVIVGVTFWYGNRQRQEQVKKDQKAAQVQTKKSSTSTVQSTKPSPAPAKSTPSPAPVSPAIVTPTPSSTPQTGSELAYLLPLGAVIVGYQVQKASKRSLKRSLLASTTSIS